MSYRGLCSGGGGGNFGSEKSLGNSMFEQVSVDFIGEKSPQTSKHNNGRSGDQKGGLVKGRDQFMCLPLRRCKTLGSVFDVRIEKMPHQ